MSAQRLLTLTALLGAIGCSNTTSSVSGVDSVNGEAWYVKTTSFAGLVFGSDVFYCPPPGSGPATCTQARMVPLGDAEAAAKVTVAEPKPKAVPKKPKADPEPDTSEDAEPTARTIATRSFARSRRAPRSPKQRASRWSRRSARPHEPPAAAWRRLAASNWRPSARELSGAERMESIDATCALPLTEPNKISNLTLPSGQRPVTRLRGGLTL